jgi:anti-anti-sigma regulatory factor
MNPMSTTVVKTNTQTECLRIFCNSNLTGNEAVSLREQINHCIAKGYPVIYLDTKEVYTADLSGINEVINSAYALANANRRFVLIYKTASVMEKWIQTTGLDKFTETAIIPAA